MGTKITNQKKVTLNLEETATPGQEKENIDQGAAMHTIKSKCKEDQTGFNTCHLFMSNNFRH